MAALKLGSLRQRRPNPPSAEELNAAFSVEPEESGEDKDEDEDEDEGIDDVIEKPSRRHVVQTSTKSTAKPSKLTGLLARVKQNSHSSSGVDEPSSTLEGSTLSELAEAADLEHYEPGADEHQPWARILVLGPAKLGKSSAVAGTAPPPVLHINCDGPNAADPARRYGSTATVINVMTAGEWRRAIKLARAAAEKGLVRSIIVDTISLLNDRMQREMERKFAGVKNNFKRWDELHKLIMYDGIDKLRPLPAHLFIIAHMTAVDDTPTGILPMMSGRGKSVVPGTVNDWVMFERDGNKKPPFDRAFLVGPQDRWAYSGRNIKRSVRIAPANVIELLEELGLTP